MGAKKMVAKARKDAAKAKLSKKQRAALKKRILNSGRKAIRRALKRAKKGEEAEDVEEDEDEDLARFGWAKKMVAKARKDAAKATLSKKQRAALKKRILNSGRKAIRRALKRAKKGEEAE